MTAPRYLIGETMREETFLVNSMLRQATQDGFVALHGAQPAYLPWHSNYPLDPSPVPPLLLGPAPCARGGLIEDTGYLQVAQDFTGKVVFSKGDEAFIQANGIVNATQKDWTPMVGVTDQQAAVFAAGVEILQSSHPSLVRLYREYIDFVMPLPGERNRGYSTLRLRGAIFRAIPSDATPYDVAIDLAHELGHNVLFAWQTNDPIMLSDQDAPLYSEIRKRVRPAIQTFHAAVALAFMHFFVESMAHDPACREAGRRRGAGYRESFTWSLRSSLATLRSSCSFSPLGERMILEMGSLVV